MGNISIRKLNDDVLKALRTRASVSGVSMEEEVRRILSKAVEADRIKLGTLAKTLISDNWDAPELEIPEDEAAPDPVLFE